MTRFVAIKLNYDHRPELPTELKYSKEPTRQEYQEYLDRFYQQGIGGEGFHECLNFAIPDDEGTVRIYLPTTDIPRERYWNDEFVFLSFTYKGDPELPSYAIGVHACAGMRDHDGLNRPEITTRTAGNQRLTFNAEAPAEYVTLFCQPIKYEMSDGIYTPVYNKNRVFRQTSG
jgi:hypothetical protein